MRNLTEWKTYCGNNVTAGYTPGGNISLIPSTGLVLVEFLHRRHLLKNSDNILDIGCANGRLAIGLQTYNHKGTYCGLDVVKPCIQFCREAFKDDDKFRFIHLDVENERYWSEGKHSPEDITFPIEANTIDTVIAFSLFTHLDTYKAAEHYLNEIDRVLKPKGSLFSTWSLTSLSNNVSMDAAHVIYHINDILTLFEKFNHWQFISLKETPVKRQVGIWSKT